jgi:uncharacterized protein (DUF1330 family)
MSAFLVAEAQAILDETAYQRYRPVGAAAVASHQGTYLIRGGSAHTLEGDWRPERLSILQFPSIEMAKAWYHSPEYQAARRIRDGAVRMRLVAIDARSA